MSQPVEPWHGKSGYTNHGCRCTECRTSHARKVREQRRRRVAKVKAGQLVVPEDAHGSYGYTAYGCRCDICREGHAVYNRENRRQKQATA